MKPPEMRQTSGTNRLEADPCYLLGEIVFYDQRNPRTYFRQEGYPTGTKPVKEKMLSGA